MNTVDKQFCLSSYMAFRYIWREDVNFAEGFQHKHIKAIPEALRVPVRTAADMDREIRRQFEALHRKYRKVGILLSGGMDSANLAAYMRPGSPAYTFTSTESDVFDQDLQRAKAYADKWGLFHTLVSIGMEDYQRHTPQVLAHKCAPVHSIEPQLLKAALQARKDGVELLVVGESADLVFGGMDKLISPEWDWEGFVRRYTFLDPSLALTQPVDQSPLFERYRRGKDGIDVMRFMDEVFAIESSGSYMNAFEAALMPWYDPYAHLRPEEPLDMARIRGGEPKYMVRELYALHYPEWEIPFKNPMPRPVDAVFKDWKGPTRPEFRKDLPMDRLTGNQKWQLWCAEKFLDLLEAR